jgi:hypothetical protein
MIRTLDSGKLKSEIRVWFMIELKPVMEARSLREKKKI